MSGHNYYNTTVLQPFVWNYLGKSVPEETFTHSHLSWSSIIIYQLPASTTGIIEYQLELKKDQQTASGSMKLLQHCTDEKA